MTTDHIKMLQATVDKSRATIHDDGTVSIGKPPTQEPVAWMSEEVLPLNHIIKAVVRREPDEQYTIPLYTHPKQWQGLSDKEQYERNR
jgi:hypothetical protein